MNLEDDIESEPEIPGKAQHQRRVRDKAVAMATLAACQEATKKWFCCPVPIRIDIDKVLEGFS